MSRLPATGPRDARRCVTFIRDHVQVHPASVLEVRSLISGEVTIVPNSERPETRDVYVAGQEVRMVTIQAAKSFVRAINESAGQVVCVQGRV